MARLRLSADEPEKLAERVRGLTEELGGFVASLSLERDGERVRATIEARVPAARLDRFLGEVKRLGANLDSETVETADVTKQIFDFEANLTNLRAEESQYLSVLRRAHTVKDILEVSERLSDVRGRIHSTEGEARYLARQVEMAAASLAVNSPPREVREQWQPAMALRDSFHDGIDSLTCYVESMVALALQLPAIALWVVTIGVMARYGWRLLVWFVRGFRLQASGSQG